MSNEVAIKQEGIKSLSSFLNGEQIKSKFTEVLGKRGPAFVASVLSVCNTNTDLKNATPESVYMAALMAATLDLPVNPNIGHAFLIPYKNHKTGITECQFQVAAKGFKQLALRTGQYLRITDTKVYEGQLVKEDPLQGFEFDWSKKKSDKIVGYVSYFKLMNGFESTLYMSKEKVMEHALRYSQTFKSKTQWVKESSKWTTDFDSMALKTVTKLNLSKNGPLSIEMQRALIADQGVIKDAATDGGTIDVSYEDNKNPEPATAEDLQILVEEVMPDLTKAELEDARRIIDNNETTSFSKLEKSLRAKIKE